MSFFSFRYRIHGKESFKLPFHLEKSTGMLRLKSSLLSESQDFYEFSIVAKLEGVEGKAMIDVIVTIDVSNKKCPQFLNLPKDNRFVIKSPKTGQTLFSPKIDSKGEVNYKLVGSNGLVEVNPSNGEVSALLCISLFRLLYYNNFLFRLFSEKSWVPAKISQ